MDKPPLKRRDHGTLSARAVVFEKPGALALRDVMLDSPRAGDIVVEAEWTGISTGTEKLLYSGRMPPFPGMGYPLVPGYETVGRVAACDDDAEFAVGDRVFVSGARCFGEIRGLFGGAASRLVVDPGKLIPVGESLEAEGILLALAATAHHALHDADRMALPELIIGHGVLGRLLARLAVDASGDHRIIDSLVQRLSKNGEIVLAGFYADTLSFTFPPAFMREASIRVVAEWTKADLRDVKQLIDSGSLTLGGLISHRSAADSAATAYPIAFSDPDCLKMVLDWRNN